MERPVFDLARAGSASDETLAAAIFGGKHRIVGNLSQWKADNSSRYTAVRQIAQAAGRVGESPEQRAQRLQRETVMHQPEPLMTPAEEIELANAITKYPRALCRQIFADGTNAEATKLHDEKPAEYALAQLAARHFQIIGTNSESVRFNYERPAEYRERIPKPVVPNEPPPGVERCADGVGYYVADSKIYGEWLALKKAREIISAAQ